MRVHPKDDQAIDGKAQRSVLEIAQGAGEQASAYKQHDAECDLEGDDDFACPGFACVGIGCC